MLHIKYFAPGSLDELLTVLHQHCEEARIIVGGTDLIPQMRLGVRSPRVLVDPIHLPLVGITESNGTISLGARLTHTQALASPLLKIEHPALVAACQRVGGPPVRNRGTLAGNLANASPAADSALPLLVYDAQIVTAQIGGGRVIPLNEFYLAPGLTQLAADEFICEIRLPKQAPRTKAVFLKLGNRQAMAIAVASVALRLSLDEKGQISQARIALGSVAPTPLRAYQAEAILQYNPLDEKTILIASQVARQSISPISDMRASAEYRSRMVTVLIHRALDMIRQELEHEKAYG